MKAERRRHRKTEKLGKNSIDAEIRKWRTSASSEERALCMQDDHFFFFEVGHFL